MHPRENRKALDRKTDISELEFGAGYTEYQINRGRLRKLVRKLYLRHAASRCHGTTLDFGCGIGELLRMLPVGSRGLEINPITVHHCRAHGLDVDLYDPDTDNYRLAHLRHGEFQTLIISHVLEHLPDPARVLRALLASCQALAIEQAVVIVPGRAGFAADPTHKTFITVDYLHTHGFFALPGIRLTELTHFPVNLRRLGDYFPYHEMMAVFEIMPAARPRGGTESRATV